MESGMANWTQRKRRAHSNPSALEDRNAPKLASSPARRFPAPKRTADARPQEDAMGKSYAAYLSSLLLFGSNGIVAAMIALPSLDIVVARTFLGALLLGMLCVAAALVRRMRRDASSPTQESGKGSTTSRMASIALFACSGAALGISWIALFEAYRLVGVGTASLLYYCGPVIVMALAPVLFKERIDAAKALGFAAVVLGACLVSIQALGGGQDARGLLLGAVSACAYAAMIVCSKKAVAVRPDAAGKGLRNTFIQLLAGFAVAAGYCIATQGFEALLIPAAPSDIAPLLVLGLLNTGVGCFFYFTSVGKLPVQTVAVLGYLEPLSAVVLSALILGEPLGAAQIVGAVLIVGGAAFCELSDSLRKRALPPLASLNTTDRTPKSIAFPR